MRTTSFALCNAETAFGVGRIDIPPAVIHRSVAGLAIDCGAPGRRDYLLPFRPMGDHLGLTSMAPAITKKVGSPARGKRFEGTGGPAPRGNAQRR